MTETKHTPIPSYPGYEATEDGRIFSVAHNWRGYGARELCQDKNADGYASVRLMVGGTRKRLSVHTLIAATFLPPKPDIRDAQVRHLDGDRMNPRADNLAWGTAADNAADRDRHGHTSRAARHSAAIKAGISASRNTYWRHAR